MEDIRSAAKKFSIKNAFDYGKAELNAVVNKVIASVSDPKSRMKEIVGICREEVAAVNLYSHDQLINAYSVYSEEFEGKAKETAERTSKPKMILDGAEENIFVTRFPPEPSGYMHIGHAKALMLEYEFALKYNGKLYLYFDDTNPEKEKQEYVDKIRENSLWLGAKFDKEYYASDNILAMYEYAKKLMAGGNAYVCTCPIEKVRENRGNSTACEHRLSSVNDNLSLWEDMLNKKIVENGAVLRMKGDLSSSNTAMRDPTLFRIKYAPHYRQGSKYVVWPTYDFNTPIMDSINGITDAIRSKEYELRDEVYYTLLKMLNLRQPRLHSISRLNIKNNLTSKREINSFLEKGLIWGYDDPRLVTIDGLRRRGIIPEAIKEFVLAFGMSKTDGVAEIEKLLSINRGLLDARAARFYAVENPIKLYVANMKGTDVKLRIYLDNSNKLREYSLGDFLYISERDIAYFAAGNKVRLKDLFDVNILSKNGVLKADMASVSVAHMPIVQWVPGETAVNCNLIFVGELIDENGEFNKEGIIEKSAVAEYAISQLNI